MNVKKIVVAILAVALSLMLALPVIAQAMVLDIPVTMWVNKSKIKVYEEPNEKSKSIAKLKGGTQILLEQVTDDGAWYATLVEDTKHGGQRLGWVMNADLIDTLPQSFCKHDWSAWEVEKEPTCTEKGYRYRFCTICGIRDEDDIKKLKGITHVYSTILLDDIRMSYSVPPLANK